MNDFPEIVADESVDYTIVLNLRQAGFNVYAICESNPSINDAQVQQIALERNALLITEDKDFGELVFRLRLPHCGILLIRLNGIDSTEKGSIITKVLIDHHFSIRNHFAVQDLVKLRIR